MGADSALQPFGHAGANHASPSVCGTARLLRRDRLVKAAHGHRSCVVEPYASQGQGSALQRLKVRLHACHAARDMCTLADRIGVLCEASFSGVKLWARPGDDPQRLEAAYHAQLRLPLGHKIAQARDILPPP